MKKEVTRGILEDMKRVTILTGQLSNVHESSLMKWPYIVFDKITNAEIEYDLSRVAADQVNYVYFKIKTEETTVNDIDKKCEALTFWVRDMFWPEIEVRVYVNGDLKCTCKYSGDEKPPTPEEKHGLN